MFYEKKESKLAPARAVMLATLKGGSGCVRSHVAIGIKKLFCQFKILAYLAGSILLCLSLLFFEGKRFYLL